MRACCNFNFSSGFNMGVIGLGGPTSNQAHSMQEIGVGCLKWNGGEDYNFSMGNACRDPWLALRWV
jgi:hypothetical protein